jgi:hypothetical protein
MSSTGPGSLLAFLAFLMLSMLLAGTYFVAYLGLVQAGREVQKAGEAASEQAIVYLFQHPTNISMVNGSPVVKGETRIVVQNVGSRDISFDRILAISPGGSVVADVKVPGNKGLGVRQWQLYKVQDLGLPDRWNNFTVFSSEVSRLVLLSERGRTHGSIWGVPPFLEGVLRATISTTMTTSYFYSYISTASYSTVYTVTLRLKPKQNAYSVMGEIWVSEDGKNWKKIEKGWDLYSGPVKNYYWDCHSYSPCDWVNPLPPCGVIYREYSKRWLENNCFDNRACLSQVGPPKIEGSNIIMVESGNRIVYQITYVRAESNAAAQAGNSFWQYGRSVYCYCDGYWCYNNRCECYRCCGNLMPAVTEWGRRYVPQAIELVDWDTGEVYGSTNSTSLTFQVWRNTIVRFKYVLAESWSRTWIIRPPPPPPNPLNCTEVLNNATPGSTEWCECAKQLDPGAAEKQGCERECLMVSVEPCCLGDVKDGCLNSWGGIGYQDCTPKSSPKTASASWSASWSLKPGWRYKDWGWVGDANCSGGPTGGTCTARIPPSRSVTIFIVFERAS